MSLTSRRRKILARRFMLDNGPQFSGQFRSRNLKDICDMKRLSFLLLVLAISVSAQAQSAEDLLQQALRLERSQGDYNGAIALYKQVSEMSGLSRPLAGRALVAMAKAYENLGRSEAARTYQRVLEDYGDIPELVARALEGYARTRAPVSEEPTPGSRSIFELPGHWDDWGAALSPSGRHVLAMVNGEEAGIGVLDIRTGDARTFRLDIEGYPTFARFSPDESKIATGWQTGPVRTSGTGSILRSDAAAGSHNKLFESGD